MRLGRAAAAAAVCVLALTGSASAQSAVDGFDPGADQDVTALAIQSDGKILAVGGFTTLGGAARNYIGRLNVDGSIDSAFNPGANAQVIAMALQSDGKILVGGLFTTLAGSTRNRIGRLNANGSIDPAFNPNPNNFVGGIVLQADGKILVSGLFTSIAGNSCSYFARLNTDGSFDRCFDPDNFVFAVAVQPDGKILAGGVFASIAGASRTRLARLNADGSIDTGFTAGADDQVSAFAVQVDGKIVVGGGFTTLAGSARSRIGRLNADGSIDPGFNPGANEKVLALALQPDGKILVGGPFTMIGGFSRSTFARLTPDGSADSTDLTSPNNTVECMVVQPDGKIVFGGGFTMLSGVIARSHIARLYEDGDNPDMNFGAGVDNLVRTIALQPDGKILLGGSFTTSTFAFGPFERFFPDFGQDTAFNPGVSGGDVFTLAVQPDGKILVGGGFNKIGGVARSSLGRVKDDGSLDMTFDPAPNNLVHAIVIQADGKLIVGGLFTTLAGATRNSIGRLNADGTLDSGFNPGTGGNGRVRTIALQADGKIVIGGDFTTMNGVARSHIARLNADGSLDSSFNPGADLDVFAVALQTDGRILVGGTFSTIAGGARIGMGRLNPDGSLDATFTTETSNGTPNAFAIQADGRILVVGDFTALANVNRRRIGRLNADGSVDSYDPGANNAIFAIAIQADGKVVVGGTFTKLGGGGSGNTNTSRLGRLTNSGAALQSLSVADCGATLSWSRSGAAPEISRVTFEWSLGGGFAPLGDGTRVSGGWSLGSQSLLVNQDVFVRARGFTMGGIGNSIFDSVRMTDVSLPSISPSSIPSATRNATYTPATFAASGGVGVVSFGQTKTLPAGMTFGGASLSGTPTHAGTFPLTVTATDAASGCVASKNFTLSVACSAISITPAALADGKVGTAYSSAIGQSGGVGTTTFSVTNGSLPAGLTLSPAGVLSETPTSVGSSTFTVTGADADSCTGSRSYTITIAAAGCPTITLSPASLPAGVVGVAYTSTTITQSGGAGTAAFSVVSGALPAGLTLSSSGVLSGTPTTAGTSSFTIRATDANGCTGTANYSVTMTSTPPSVTASHTALNYGAVNDGSSAFSVQTPAQTVALSASGAGTVSWTATATQPWITVSPASGTVPAILTIAITKTAAQLTASATGAVNITLTGASNAGVTVTVSAALYKGATSASVGVIDTPPQGALGVQGSAAVTGWALDDIAIDRVEIWRDLQPGETTPPFASTPTDPRNGKVFIGNATLVDGARPDVEALSPSMPLNYRAGWGYLLLTWGLWNRGNGQYTLYAFSFDLEGHVSTLGQKTFTADNAHASKPFGSVDTPGIGGSASGTIVNFGWGLTPNAGGTACRVPSNGVQVSIDSGPLQPVVYGDVRTDIQGAFSTFTNSNAAGGHYVLDTTQFANGVHTIGWLITDDCSRADGVGSRFFTVTNGVSAVTASSDAQLRPKADTTELGSVVSAFRRKEPTVLLARGYGELPEMLSASDGETHTVETRQGERIELRLPRGFAAAYQVVTDGQQRDLPAGSTWDAASGIFYWQPAPAFLGQYRIVFTDGSERISVRVIVTP